MPGQVGGSITRLLRAAVAALVVATVAVAVAGDPASAASTTFTGTVTAGGTAFKSHSLSVSSAGTITASLDWEQTSANLQLQLKDPSGVLVAKSFTSDRPEVITYDATKVGTYKLGVKAASGSSAYTLSVSFPGTSAPQYQRTIGGPGHAEMYPSGLDVGPDGTLYVADTGDDQIQAYASNGTLLWTMGSRGPKAPGRFSNPRDVAVHDGRVYVADTGYRRIQVLDAVDGSVITVWSHVFGTILGVSRGVDAAGQPVILVPDVSTTATTGSTVKVFTPAGSLVRTIGTGPGSGQGELNEPRDAATDSDGNVYVADYGNDRMAKFSATGVWIANWGVKGSEPGNFRRPYGVDVDDADRVYVADSNNHRIQRLTTAGVYEGEYGDATDFFMLRRVAVGSGTTPAVYGADLWGVRAQRYTYLGVLDRTYGGTPPALGRFNEPGGMAIDGDDVFVVDTVNQRVQRFSSTGTFELAWGERGWGEGNPGFNWAQDVAVDLTAGTVWVADTKNYRFTEFTRDGAATGRTLGRFLGAGDGSFNWPFALEVHDGDLIVADTNNHRVQRWHWETAGGSTCTDPKAAPPCWSLVWTAPDMRFPKDLAISGGTAFVADSLNKRVVRLSLDTGAVLGTFGGSALHRPEGVAVAPSGAVWVADTSWNRLVQFSSTGTVLQIFGGLGTAHGRFNQPTHLEISGTDLYVADVWNDRVEVFSLS
jgi:hypothetical protein